MTNSESPGTIEGPKEPLSQFYIMPQIMVPASMTPQCRVFKNVLEESNESEANFNLAKLF